MSGVRFLCTVAHYLTAGLAGWIGAAVVDDWWNG
jgi:hypothetical protein